MKTPSEYHFSKRIPVKNQKNSFEGSFLCRKKKSPTQSPLSELSETLPMDRVNSAKRSLWIAFQGT
ncbi:hypothetical protein DLM76_15925 [Leptospira yasudae]|nr:hypothetical protein DLM76_15925 [Leptospira yasudae]